MTLTGGYLKGATARTWISSSYVYRTWDGTALTEMTQGPSLLVFDRHWKVVISGGSPGRSSSTSRTRWRRSKATDMQAIKGGVSMTRPMRTLPIRALLAAAVLLILALLTLFILTLAPPAHAASLPLVWSAEYKASANDVYNAVATAPGGVVYAAGYAKAGASGATASCCSPSTWTPAPPGRGSGCAPCS